MPQDTPVSQEESRNLANTHKLAPWLEAIADMKLGPVFERDERQAAGAKWLMTVGRKAVMKSGAVRVLESEDPTAESEWIQKSIANGRAVQVLDLGADDRSKLERAMDWLMSPAGPGAGSDWSRISLAAALEAEAKWIDEMERQSADVRLDGAVALGTRAVPGLEDLAGSETGEEGTRYSWVELSNPEALAREGGLMHHCVGIYGNAVSSGKTRIFSLRDPAGSPRATVELTRGCFQQLKIKGDNQTDPFCALAARALIANTLPQILAAGQSPSCGPDFVRTGYGLSNILGFCDLSVPLDDGSRSIVSKWLATFGDSKSSVREEMRAAASAGGTFLFNALKSHGGDWWRVRSIIGALFSNEAMISCLSPVIADASKRHGIVEAHSTGSKLPDRSITLLVVKAIGSGCEEMWDNLLRLEASPAELIDGVKHLASAPGAVGDSDLARFIRWIPSGHEQAFTPSSLSKDPIFLKAASLTAFYLASSRFEQSLGSLRLAIGQQHFPWASAARGAAASDSVGMLQWVLQQAPVGSLFAGALYKASARQKSRCLPLLLDEQRTRDHLGSAICEASALDAEKAITALNALETFALGATGLPASYAQGLLDAARLGPSHESDTPLFRSVESLAWLLARIENEPSFPDLLSLFLAKKPPVDKNFQASHSTFLTSEPDAPAAAQAGAVIGALSLKHLSAQHLLDLCSSRARHGLDQPALFFWNLAQGKSGIDDILRAGAKTIATAAAKGECDALFAAVGGSAPQLALANITFDKAMGMGCWRMASIIADGDPALLESMKDALILAVPSAPLETIKALLSQCDPKRKNSQALVAAARSGRVAVVELLAPLCDPTALNSEPLRSAAARGDGNMVDILLPLSDPRAGDSHAMRDALRAGHWDIASELWPLSDPNSGSGEALALAARSGDVDRMRWMVQHGSDPMAGSSSALRTLITHASNAPNAAFDLLWELSNPAHLDSKDFLLAVKANRLEWVEKMLPHANPDANACAPLRAAANMGELELMQLLIPASDPFKAETIIKAEGFGDDDEASLLSLIKHRPATPRSPT